MEVLELLDVSVITTPFSKAFCHTEKIAAATQRNTDDDGDGC